MKIYLATDHAGFELKEEIKKYLEDSNFNIEDCGAEILEDGDDYPDFISKAAEKISLSPNEGFAVIFGKSGTGEAIVANKFKNVRCVLGFSEDNVRLSREHNNANILSLGSQFINSEQAKKLTEIFLKTKFSGEVRHIRRINKILEIEQKNYA